MTDRGNGHERRDVDVVRVAIIGAGLAAMIAVSMVMMIWAFDFFVARESRSQPPPSTLTARPASQLPAEPRLQQNPLADLRVMRAEEDGLLGSYAWVDRDRGVVRLPIDRAMSLLVERGLPARREVTP